LTNKPVASSVVPAYARRGHQSRTTHHAEGRRRTRTQDPCIAGFRIIRSLTHFTAGRHKRQAVRQNIERLPKKSRQQGQLEHTNNDIRNRQFIVFDVHSK
jgi:hypothetical protein